MRILRWFLPLLLAVPLVGCEPHFMPSRQFCSLFVSNPNEAIIGARDYDVGTVPFVNCVGYDTVYGYFCFTVAWSDPVPRNYLVSPDCWPP